jgi:hypothetical protein
MLSDHERKTLLDVERRFMEAYSGATHTSE